jgi:sugar phosphate permease
VGYLIGSVLGGCLADVMNPACAMALPLFVCAVATVLIPFMTHSVTLAVTIASKGVAAGMLDTGQCTGRENSAIRGMIFVIIMMKNAYITSLL